ncbi:hypothetical protein FKM82_001464 [Ascaphus truei]
MSSIADRDDGSIFDGLVDEDDKDKAKRVSRNKSEKKRRDQFNILIKELGAMLPRNAQRMDKSTVLQKSIDFLRKTKEISAQTDASEIRQDWKPTFLTNEEFTQLMLEALDGFFLAVMTDGNVIYVSESVTPLLEHLPSDLVDQSIFNFVPEREHSEVYEILSTHMLENDSLTPEYLKTKNQLEFCCHMLRGTVDPKGPATYEFVKFIGNFKSLNNVLSSTHNGFDAALQRSLRPTHEERACFVATVRLATPQFIKEMCTVEELNEEFTSRHSLEWKFLFLDHSYAEVGAERRLELGIEDSEPETTDKNRVPVSGNHINTVSLKEALDRFEDSRSPSISPKSSIKSSSHTAVSEPSSTPTKIPTDTSPPPQQALSGLERRRSSISSQSMSSQPVTQSLSQPVMKQPTAAPQLQPGMTQFTAQFGAMKNLKDQLEQRTRMIEANIHRQQEELRKIQEQLQMVHGQGFPMFLQQSTPGINFGPVQVSSGNTSSMQHLTQLNMQSQAVQANQIQGGMNTGHLGSQHIIQQQKPLQHTNQQGQQNMHGGHSQQTSLSSQTPGTFAAPLYNTMVISQPSAGNMVQMTSSMPQNNQGAAMTTFSQDRQIRFTQGQQLVTKLMTTPVACGAVMVPSTMFMGQVVTAYPTFATQQQPQTLSITQQQQSQQDQQQQIPAVQQPTHAQLTQQFLQASRLVHGNQSAQLILSAFPVQQNTFAPSHQQQLSRHRTDNMTDPSKVQQQ